VLQLFNVGPCIPSPPDIIHTIIETKSVIASQRVPGPLGNTLAGRMLVYITLPFRPQSFRFFQLHIHTLEKSTACGWTVVTSLLRPLHHDIITTITLCHTYTHWHNSDISIVTSHISSYTQVKLITSTGTPYAWTVVIIHIHANHHYTKQTPAASGQHHHRQTNHQYQDSIRLDCLHHHHTFITPAASAKRQSHNFKPHHHHTTLQQRDGDLPVQGP
jgi:hypothetical protein